MKTSEHRLAQFDDRPPPDYAPDDAAYHEGIAAGRKHTTRRVVVASIISFALGFCAGAASQKPERKST